MTMVERLAKVLADTLDANGEVIIMDCRMLARTALQAMREPTEAMWRAGADSIDGYMRLEHPHAYAIEAKGTWQAMIDAALLPPPSSDGE